MRIAITGSKGMLGFALNQVFTDTETIGLTRGDFDITDLDKTSKSIEEIRPDYLIHAAAHTDVDDCELNPEKALLVNGIGTRNVVMACEKINCPVIYVSTDYVFDGSKKAPYEECDKTHPINKYGLSKLIGERFVTSLTNRYYIVRTSWLYGKNGKNFVDSIIGLLPKKKKIDVVNDQVGSPTYNYDFAQKLREIIGRGYGIYHVTNTSQCSWYELAVEIARIKGVKAEINPITSKEFKRPARRPTSSMLGNAMLRLEGIKELRQWKNALEDYLSSG